MVWDFDYKIPRWYAVPRHPAGRCRFGGEDMARDGDGRRVAEPRAADLLIVPVICAK